MKNCQGRFQGGRFRISEGNSPGYMSRINTALVGFRGGGEKIERKRMDNGRDSRWVMVGNGKGNKR